MCGNSRDSGFQQKALVPLHKKPSVLIPITFQLDCWNYATKQCTYDGKPNRMVSTPGEGRKFALFSTVKDDEQGRKRALFSTEKDDEQGRKRALFPTENGDESEIMALIFVCLYMDGAQFWQPATGDYLPQMGTDRAAAVLCNVGQKTEKDFWMVETEIYSQFLVSFELSCTAGPDQEEISSCGIDPSLNKGHHMQINEDVPPGSPDFGKEAKAKILVKSGGPTKRFTATNSKLGTAHIREYSLSCDGKRGATVSNLSFDVFPAVMQSAYKKFGKKGFPAEVCSSLDKLGSKVKLSLPGIGQSTVTIAFLVDCHPKDVEEILSCDYQDTESGKIDVKAGTPTQVYWFKRDGSNAAETFEFSCSKQKGAVITPVDLETPLSFMGTTDRAASALCIAGKNQSPVTWEVAVDGKDVTIPIVFNLDCAAGNERVKSCKHGKIDVTPADDPQIISAKPKGSFSSRKYKLGCGKLSGASLKSA